MCLVLGPRHLQVLGPLAGIQTDSKHAQSHEYYLKSPWILYYLQAGLLKQKWPRLSSLVHQPINFHVYNCLLLGEKALNSTSLSTVVMVYPHMKLPLCLRSNLLWLLRLSPRNKLLLFTLPPLKGFLSPCGLFASLWFSGNTFILIFRL